MRAQVESTRRGEGQEVVSECSEKFEPMRREELVQALVVLASCAVVAATSPGAGAALAKVALPAARARDRPGLQHGSQVSVAGAGVRHSLKDPNPNVGGTGPVAPPQARRRDMPSPHSVRCGVLPIRTTESSAEAVRVFERSLGRRRLPGQGAHTWRRHRRTPASTPAQTPTRFTRQHKDTDAPTDANNHAATSVDIGADPHDAADSDSDADTYADSEPDTDADINTDPDADFKADADSDIAQAPEHSMLQ